MSGYAALYQDFRSKDIEQAIDETQSLNAIKLNSCIKCIQENRDILVGIKVRLDK